MSDKKLTIYFYCADAYGQMNPCIGVAQQLYNRGHRIIFALKPSWKGRLSKFGFEEEILQPENVNSSEKDYANSLNSLGFFSDKSSYEKLKIYVSIGNHFVKGSIENEPLLEASIKKMKPDLIIVSFMFMPCILKSKIPWVNLMPANPLLGISHKDTPPAMSGLPINDKTEWPKYRELWKDYFKDIEELNKWYVSLGAPGLNTNGPTESPYLNLYAYPEELDYTDVRPTPSNWYRFDTFIKQEENEDDFQIPEKLKDKPGKLIYFSIGSMGSLNVELMKKIIAVLGELPHRFIISKGIFGDQIDLPDNCWGEKMVPQIKILPIVDFAIIHGGNNSVTEAFYFGKPMIVMPLFVDQFDNAQRIHEKGFGLRLNAYQCTKDELANAINKLICNNELILKMKKISQRIQDEVKSGKVGQLIENLVFKFNNI